MEFDERTSGISLINKVRWGSHFCLFYQTRKDLLDVLVPYFKAGLENNESCLWVTFGPVTDELAKKVLEKAVPRYEEYVRKGQIEIIPFARMQAAGGKSGRAIEMRVDKAISRGFDGLRIASSAFPEKKGSRVYTCSGTETVTRYNVIAAFAYPRDKFDALRLMDVVKNHWFALLKNAGEWEVIESAEARTAKDALKRSEEKLHSLFSNMSEGFAYHRIVQDGRGKPIDYVFLEVNAAFERLTGLKTKQIIGKRVTEALPGIENDTTDWIGIYGKVALTGKPVQFESYSGPLKKWYTVSAFGPHKGYFAVTISDITGRKQAEEDLRENEQRFRATFEQAAVGIENLDLSGRFFKVNKKLQEMLGYTEQELLETSFDRITEAADLEKELPLIEQLLAGSIPSYTIEKRYIRRNGDAVWVRVTSSVARTSRPYRVSIIEDITERKRVEKELEEEKLAVELKAAELSAVNKELETFSYSVSHDLRAPIRHISGFVELLRKGAAQDLDEKNLHYLNVIADSTKQMGRLIDDLLSFSRTGRTGINRQRIDCNALVRETIQTLACETTGRAIAWEIASLPGISADPLLIRLIWSNLVANALKFTRPRTNARIEIGAEDKNGEIIFHIKDNGVGFDMQYKNKLFTIFQRLHRPEEFEGTGIGLANVQRIVHRHGGRVWAEGIPDSGAAFFFSIPK